MNQVLTNIEENILSACYTDGEGKRINDWKVRFTNTTIKK